MELRTSPKPERTLSGRLSVFAGGFTLDAVEAVCGIRGEHPSPSVLDGLASLVDKSLVRQSEQPDTGTRFEMLEMSREYGAELLLAGGDAADTQRSHARFFLELAEAGHRGLRSPDQLVWHQRLVNDRDNLRSASRARSRS